MAVDKKKRKYVESNQVQIPLIQWAQYHPICRDFLFAIKNENIGSLLQGVFYKKMGVKKGMPDLFLAYPNSAKKHCGYFIELKAKGKNPTKAQEQMFFKLRSVGFKVEWFDDWEKAKCSIENYIEDHKIFCSNPSVYF